MKEHFGSDSFLDPMTKLVSFKQQGSIDQFHDRFLSLLNQFHFLEAYALSIFTSNLKPEVGQYLRLFKPQTLVEGYMLARQVESIVLGTSRKGLSVGSGVGLLKHLFSNPKVHHSTGGSSSMRGSIGRSSR